MEAQDARIRLLSNEILDNSALMRKMEEDAQRSINQQSRLHTEKLDQQATQFAQTMEELQRVQSQEKA